MIALAFLSVIGGANEQTTVVVFKAVKLCGSFEGMNNTSPPCKV